MYRGRFVGACRMPDALKRPKRKNPVLRTRQPILPPWGRSRIALRFTAAAARGRFELQQCSECGRIQYPPREMCDGCLSVDLTWVLQDGAGELLAETTQHHSHDLFFRERMPWRLGLVRLRVEQTVVAHLHGDVAEPGTRVRVEARLDRAGRGVLIAFPIEDVANMSDDRQLRELTCDPKFRRALVTDAKSEVGQAMVRALVDAGASRVWAGLAEPWKETPGFEGLSELEEVTVVPLDVTDERSVREQAGSIGGRVDILINTSEVHRTQTVSSRRGTDVAKLEMEVNYFGLLRLAQEFGAAMKARGADGQNSAVAWVNILSVYALSNLPDHGTFSASKAAAYSLSQAMRADFKTSALKVVNVFPGPIDEPWNQLVPPPKIAPERLARDTISALCNGIEDVFPGDVAQEIHERWLEDPKVLELELTS